MAISILSVTVALIIIIGFKKNKLRSEEDDVTIVEGIKLTGTTSVKISSDGFAKFNNLGITGSSTGTDLSLEFYLDGAEICVSFHLF